MSKMLALSFSPGSFSRYSRRRFCVISALPWLSSLKNSSVLTPLDRRWSRRAPVTVVCASLATCFRAPFTATICFLHLASRAPTLTFSFTRELLASVNGPLAAVLIESMCSLIFAWPFSMDATTASRLSSALSIAASGFSWSAPRLLTSASVAGSTFSISLARPATMPSASSTTEAAAFFSASSCLRFRSCSMASFMRFSDCPIFFFSCECSYWTLLTRGRIFASSALVSARGPVFTAFSSSDFCSRCLATSLAASAHSWSARSILRCMAVCGEYGSR
mmetsp:Transcript_3530/g.10275  ORF Transcript_3530/g.10275 Transcript_3530/m.10275 type:complete len:278 (-) Transcript_3530:3851-4684(-)